MGLDQKTQMLQSHRTPNKDLVRSGRVFYMELIAQVSCTFCRLRFSIRASTGILEMLFCFVFGDESRQRRSRTVIVALAGAILQTAFIVPRSAFAQEVVTQKQVGNWSVYYVKDSNGTRPQGCSVVTAVVA